MLMVSGGESCEPGSSSDKEVAARIFAERYVVVYAALVREGLTSDGEFADQAHLDSQSPPCMPAGPWPAASQTIRPDKAAPIGEVIRAQRGRFN